MARCKACHLAYGKQQLSTPAGKEKRNQWRRDHFARNREKLNAASAAWRRANPEKARAIQRDFDRKRRDTRKAYRAVNVERDRAVARRWRERIADRVKRQLVAYYQSHRPDFHARNHIRRARVAGAEGKWTAKEWHALKARYGYRCLCCGKDEPGVLLTPDHVIPLARGGSNQIENIQPLCRPCNIRKNAKTIDYRPTSRAESGAPLQLRLF